jgi:hypothetical protein
MFASRERIASGLVVVAAAIIALVSARPYAGAWNDGSRLATVESLVDRGTLAIDNSLFVTVPDGPNNPYRGTALDHGTLDKLLIDGHYYSDKSPVPALLLAILYEVLQQLFGLQARFDPALFCYAMTVLSSGGAYIVAVACVFKFGKPLQLSLVWRLLVCASFALASVAVVYVEHVNNHALLLGVAAVVMLLFAQAPHTAPWWRPVLIGGLVGLGYSIDLGAGPPLVACAGLLVAWQYRPRLAACSMFALGVLPLLALHHVVNYAVGGTLVPANAVPEHFNWPGCPFHGAALTGSWHHASVLHCLGYAVDMLLGKRGFIGHNPALYLLVPVAVVLLKKRAPQRPPLAFAAAWAGATWLLYAATSHNYSGANCSIRWFVPLLAPAYYALSVVLERYPAYRVDFLLLSGWGLLLMAIAWWHGPWTTTMVPGYWPIQIAALVSWGGLVWRRQRQKAASRSLLVAKAPAEEETVLSAALRISVPGEEHLDDEYSAGPFLAGPGAASRRR